VRGAPEMSGGEAASFRALWPAQRSGKRVVQPAARDDADRGGACVLVLSRVAGV